MTWGVIVQWVRSVTVIRCGFSGWMNWYQQNSWSFFHPESSCPQTLLLYRPGSSSCLRAQFITEVPVCPCCLCGLTCYLSSVWDRSHCAVLSGPLDSGLTDVSCICLFVLVHKEKMMEGEHRKVRQSAELLVFHHSESKSTLWDHTGSSASDEAERIEKAVCVCVWTLSLWSLLTDGFHGCVCRYRHSHTKHHSVCFSFITCVLSWMWWNSLLETTCIFSVRTPDNIQQQRRKNWDVEKRQKETKMNKVKHQSRNRNEWQQQNKEENETPPTPHHTTESVSLCVCVWCVGGHTWSRSKPSVSNSNQKDSDSWETQWCQQANKPWTLPHRKVQWVCGDKHFTFTSVVKTMCLQHRNSLTSCSQVCAAAKQRHTTTSWNLQRPNSSHYNSVSTNRKEKGREKVLAEEMV